MASDALHRFRESMQIDYEKWHDGIGYDLDAIDELDARGQKEAERLLIPRAGNDWRDLEALDRLGTPGAVKAILDVRKKGSAEMRLRAYGYGPAAKESDWDSVIVDLLKVAKPYEGLTVATSAALEHPSAAVVAELWRHVVSPSEIAYHAAETLACIAGASEDPYDFTHRPLLLRVQGPDTVERKAAVKELQDLCAGTPGACP
ncbi:MAG: hypothetical protein ABUL72_07165 [Armatimonadota bacterium]